MHLALLFASGIALCMEFGEGLQALPDPRLHDWDVEEHSSQPTLFKNIVHSAHAINIKDVIHTYYIQLTSKEMTHKFIQPLMQTP